MGVGIEANGNIESKLLVRLGLTVDGGGLGSEVELLAGHAALNLEGPGVVFRVRAMVLKEESSFFSGGIEAIVRESLLLRNADDDSLAVHSIDSLHVVVLVEVDKDWSPGISRASNGVAVAIVISRLIIANRLLLLTAIRVRSISVGIASHHSNLALLVGNGSPSVRVTAKHTWLAGVSILNNWVVTKSTGNNIAIAGSNWVSWGGRLRRERFRAPSVRIASKHALRAVTKVALSGVATSGSVKVSLNRRLGGSTESESSDSEVVHHF